MFTGFATENTPAIQVWDLFSASSGTTRIALADDCAPIQFFRTGGSATAINVYLPSSPIEGKQIKIINASYNSTPQSIDIWSSDSSPFSSSIIRIGAGQTLDLCYSKNFLSSSPAAVGDRNTGWIFLNQTPINSWNFNSVTLGGNNNSAERSRSAVIGGSTNTASGTSAAVIGGDTSQASGSGSAVLGGSSGTASGAQSVVIGGTSNTANSGNSVVVGGNSGTTRAIIGNFVTPASSNPIASIVGRTQFARLLLGRETIDATATRLTSNPSAASNTNQVILPNNSAYAFQGTVIANVTGAGNTSAWKFEGAIKRGANAASTALVAAVTPTVIAQDAGASAWVVAVTADTTNGGIAVTVTGAAATTIRWVCKIETTEVAF